MGYRKPRCWKLKFLCVNFTKVFQEFQMFSSSPSLVNNVKAIKTKILHENARKFLALIHHHPPTHAIAELCKNKQQLIQFRNNGKKTKIKFATKMFAVKKEF